MMFSKFVANSTRWRGSGAKESSSRDGSFLSDNDDSELSNRTVQVNWRRILLLISAITVHNIPGWSDKRCYLGCTLFKAIGHWPT